MTAKEFLKQYEYADRRVRRLEEEILDLEAMVGAVRSASDNDGMPHGHNISRPTEELALRLVDAKLKHVDELRIAMAKREEVFNLVNSIDGVEGDLLFERYVKLRKWEEICCILHYSWQGIHKVHGRALLIVEGRLK